MYRLNEYLHYLHSLVHWESCDVLVADSQDVVDGSGPGALGGAGLRLGAARREVGGGGGGGGVPQACGATAGLHRGQTVHDAGQTLQAGGAGRLIGRNLCRQKVGTFERPFRTLNPGSGSLGTGGGPHRSWHTGTRCCRLRSSAATPDCCCRPARKGDGRFTPQSLNTHLRLETKDEEKEEKKSSRGASTGEGEKKNI